MKKILFALSVILLIASCQSEAGRKAHAETLRLQKESDSLREIVERYKNASTVYESLLKYDLAAGTNDAHDKLILQIGKTEAEWFFNRSEELDIKKHTEDSIESSKLDSMKKLRATLK